jgi:O-antigen ligase
MRRFGTIVQRPSNRILGLTLLLMLVSSVLADRPADAFLGLLNFLPCFFIFAGLRELLQTPDQLRRLAWILVLTSLPVVAIGLAQQFLGWASQVEILWFVVDWKVDAGGNPLGRMSSVFFYATVLAAYFVITLCLSLGLLAEAWQEQRTNRNKLQLGFLSVTVVANAIGLVLTNSRNAWAIAVLICLVFAVYLGWRWLVAAVTAVAGLVGGAAFAPVPLRDGLRKIVPAFFWARLTDELYPDRPVVQLRSTQWEFAWSLAQQRPWTGWGLRSFPPLYEAQTQLVLGHPHNLPLMLACEVGLPTTLLFYGWVGWVLVRGSLLLRFWRSFPPATAPLTQFTIANQMTLFTYLVAFGGCTLFSLLDIPLFDPRLNLLGWLLLSAICGVTDSIDPTDP